MNPCFASLFILALLLTCGVLHAADPGFEMRLVVPEGTPAAVKKPKKVKAGAAAEDLWCGEVLLDSTAIQSARAYEYLPGQWKIVVELTAKGKEDFGKISSDHVGHQLGILSKGEVLSAPRVNEPIFGGRVEIAGNFSEKEAKDLAKIFMNGTPSAKPTPGADAKKGPDPAAK